MPVDDRDERSPEASPEKESPGGVHAALQSETDEPLPPAAEALAEKDADHPEPVTPQGQRRRYLTRRNAAIATLAIAIGIVAVIAIGLLAYRLGYIDRYVANQIKTTLAQYNIRAEIRDFHAAFGPRSVEMRGIELYDSVTGEMLGRAERLLVTVRIEDMYALNLRRNVNLETLTIDGLEAWVKFDEQGNSNFRNIELPPPDPNSRILFSYSTAKINLNNGVIHYGDEQHDLAGEARNIVVTVQPDDPNAPAESRMNTVTLAASNSSFVYDGRPVNDIGINARGRINQVRAEIQELVLRSPVAEARLQGVMDDWRNLRYQMQVTSTVDLTQASDVLQAGTTLRGAGQFVGNVTGEGSRYQVTGEIKSDALAADNIRLKGLNVNIARASGDGKSYDVNARAIAELLTAGDFTLNSVQLAGNVMGTGTDFRWIGELRTAAARGFGTTIAGLILSDATAEMRGDVLTANAGRLTAAGINTADARVSGAQVSNIRVRNENGVTTATVANAQAGTLTASGARVNGAMASGIDVVDRDGTTSVTVDQVRVDGINAAGARIGSLNVAGVRLAVRDGRIQGSSGDINVGTVAFDNGRAENVRLARPVFRVEPQGSYRASADLSVGGGVLGQLRMGAARAAVVATSTQIQLNNLTAEVFNGRATGSATISTTRRGASRVTVDFSNLDVGGLIAATSGRAVPVSGSATGTVDLSFPGMDFTAATGNLRASLTGETGDDATGRTPLTGEVALRAERGLFSIERGLLRAGASELTASGQFSVEGDSNLQLNLASADAAELQNVVLASGFIPDLEEQLSSVGLGLAGRLTFNGSVRGPLTEPSIDGRAALDSVRLQGRDLGSLAANINATPTEVRVTDGRLTERDGGGIQFALNAPLTGENNISIDATLDRVNAGNIVAALSGAAKSQASGPADANQTALSSIDLQSDLSGRINVTGLPNAMNGSADLRFGAGRIGREPFESIVARATFNGSNISVDTIDARLSAGQVTASGTVNLDNQRFDLQARAIDIKLDSIQNLAGNTGGAVPQLTGVANLNARASGKLDDFSTYQVNFDGEGRDVTINGRPAGVLTLVGRTENQQLSVNFTTGLLGQPQTIAARVDLSNDRLPMTVETTLTGADLTPLFAALMPPGTDITVRGRATGALRISGNLQTENEAGEDVFGLTGLRGTARFSELSFQIEDIQLAATDPLLVQITPNEIFFERTQFTGTGTNVTLGGTAALGPGGRQNLTVDGRLNLRVLNTLSPNNFLSGTAEVAVRVGGTFEQPRITGSASVAGASFTTLVADQRLALSNIKGRVIFNSNQAQLESLTGTLGGGTINASGGATLAGFVPSGFRLSVRADNVTVPLPEDIRATADADVEISGTTREQILRGTVNLRRAEYTQDIELADLINRRREGALTEGGGGESSFAATTQLDLRVEGRDALVVRNNIADIVGSVSLHITGPAEDPIIGGRITATRGTLVFRNDRYEVTRAYIDLPPRRGADPLLNIQAEAEIKGYTIIVSLTGPLSQPNAAVRSDPALPQADVVALITTGNLAADDGTGSTLTQAGIGTAASLLANTLIGAPAQRATNRLFGLNRFEIDPLVAGRGGASPTARLTLGRQINRNLTVTYSTNVTSDQNQVIAVEYRVSNRLSFIAQYQQGSSSGITSRNDNFNFEIRFRRRF